MAPDDRTPGQVAVNTSFNPSENPKVDKLKQLAAEMFDIVEQSVPADNGVLATTRLRKLRDSALHDILVAQMIAVKVVTSEGAL